jgi:uncharacterized protein (TIGR00297 family)
MSIWAWYIIAICIIGSTTLICESLSKRFTKYSWLFRKLLHIVAVSFCAWCTYLSNDLYLLSILFFLCGIALTMLIKFKKLWISSTPSFGIALFPFAFCILLALPFLPKATIVCSICILAFSDALGAVAGICFAKKYYIFLSEKKSFIGSVVFFITTCIICSLFFYKTPWFGIIIVSLIITISELYSWRGSDNFTIPIVACFCLAGVPNNPNILNAIYFVLIGTLAIPFLIKKRWLNLGASVAAVLLGTAIVFCVGFNYLIFPILFLLLGTLISKLFNTTKKTTAPRDSFQVWHNSLVALVCIFLYALTKQPIFLWSYYVAFSVAICDTVSSEFGVAIKAQSFSIVNFKKAAYGTSGAISIAGSMAGLIASCLIAAITYCFFYVPLYVGFYIIGFGFIGMMLDSFLGATIQAKYLLANNNIITENANKEAVLIKGWAWCTNSMVNFLSITLTILLFIVWNYFLHT